MLRLEGWRPVRIIQAGGQAAGYLNGRLFRSRGNFWRTTELAPCHAVTEREFAWKDMHEVRAFHWVLFGSLE